MYLLLLLNSHLANLLYYFVRCSSELAEVVHVPYSSGWFMHYFDSVHDCSVNIPRCGHYKYVYAVSLFHNTGRFCKS